MDKPKVVCHWNWVSNKIPFCNNNISNGALDDQEVTWCLCQIQLIIEILSLGNLLSTCFSGILEGSML